MAITLAGLFEKLDEFERNHYRRPEKIEVGYAAGARLKMETGFARNIDHDFYNGKLSLLGCEFIETGKLPLEEVRIS